MKHQTRNRPVNHVIDALEPRRLFTLDLFMTTGGVLNISETATIDNTTFLQMTNDNTQLKISDGADTIADTASMEDNGWTFTNNGTATETGPISSVTSILLDTNNGNDILNVLSLTVPLTIDPRGAASEEIELGNSSYGGAAQQITGQIYFNGTNAKSLLLDVDDRTNTQSINGQITSSSIMDLTPAPIYFSPAVGGGANARTSLSFEGGTRDVIFLDQSASDPTPIDYDFPSFGLSSIEVQQLNANSTVNINAQANATAMADIGENGSLSALHGSITVNGNAGVATLDIDDSADTASHTFTAKTNGGTNEFDVDGTQLLTFSYPVSTINLETDIFANTVNLDLGNFDGVSLTTTVTLAGTNDTTNVTQIPQGSTFDLTGAAGITTATFNAAEIKSANVTLTDPIGNVALTLDGSQFSQAQAVAVGSLFTQGLGTSTFVYTNANLSSLSLIGGTDFDNFTVTPNTTFPITVDGGKDSAGILDRLAISDPKLFPNITLAFTPDSTTAGTFTIPGKQPINFLRVATLDPDFGQLTGTVYNAQNTAPLANATVFVDQNNNGTFDTGEPTTTTDAAGTFSFSGLPVGTFNLLSTDPGFTLTAPVSITVATGVLTSATSLTMIPTPVSTGPDLSATTTAPVTKLATIKPKVTVKLTNLAATTAAATIQIMLFASTDQTLDPTDTALFTTTEPILLKTKKAKAFTFTANTSAALPKGTYYILAAVDTANAISESNESNNVSSTAKPILLAPPYVDLTGKFAPLPKVAKKSKPLTVTLLLQNLGTIPAASSIDITLYASSDQTLDNNDTALVTNSPITLHIAAAKTQPAKFKLNISALPSGSYYLIAKLNTTNSQPESDLTNNTIVSPTAITIS